MTTEGDLERLGGAVGLRRTMQDFVRAMADDFVIGFLFVGRDLDRIAQHEAELAGVLFGGQDPYTGRGLVAVHRPLKVHRGHFRRRLFVLRTSLVASGTPLDLVERWVQHHASMEDAIVLPFDCLPDDHGYTSEPRGPDPDRN